MPMTMTVEQPDAREIWLSHTAQKPHIRWTRGGLHSPTVEIAVLDEACRVLKHLEAASAPNSGEAQMAAVPLLPEGRYTVRVRAVDGSVTACSEPFQIKTPYQLTVAGGIWVAGRTYAVGWRTTDPPATRIRLDLYGGPGSGSFRFPLATLVGDMANTGRADVTIPAGTEPGTRWICLLPNTWGMCFFSAPITIVSAPR